ncbi:hypothetical protein AC579_3125 [Pseudocercospora musae]|uniref:RING-type domain-containing protein n=1 Tax=Pseudocercospora musae TaxID=113226 RepID=A0A139IA46_9PEZI|nr:hypothetical protein AC579_3125 [Pseudocercospora musae]
MAAHLMAEFRRALMDFCEVFQAAAELSFEEIHADFFEPPAPDILSNVLLTVSLLLPQLISPTFTWIYLVIMAMPNNLGSSSVDEDSQPQLPGTHAFLENLPSAQSSISADEVCAFCKDEFKDPIQLPCHHHFCRQCMVTLAEWGKSHCQICSRPLYNDIIQSNRLSCLLVIMSSIEMTLFMFVFTRRILLIMMLLSMLEHIYLGHACHEWIHYAIITSINSLPAGATMGSPFLDMLEELEGEKDPDIWPLEMTAACLFVVLFASLWLLQVAGAGLVFEMCRWE